MTPAGRVMDEVLGVGWRERVVVVHDDAGAEIARALEDAAAERKADAVRIDWQALAPRPWTSCPAEILEAIAAASATVLVVQPVDGEFAARRAFVEAATAARTRHAHMVGVSRRAFVESMAVASARTFDLLRMLKMAVRPSSRLVVRGPSGTNLQIDTDPSLRWFANGNAARPGEFVNVPFGALVTSPGAVEGVYVADAALGGGLGARAGLLSSRPVRLEISGGRVVGVTCRDTEIERYVERFVAEGGGQERVGLVSLGANLSIQAPLGELVHDENLPGVHISLGEPFGARTGAAFTARGQLGFAMAESDVDLDGVHLVRGGKFVRFV